MAGALTPSGPTGPARPRGTDPGLISQGLFYMAWLTAHREALGNLVRDRLGASAAAQVRWTTPRLICVAGDFMRYHIHAVREHRWAAMGGRGAVAEGSEDDVDQPLGHARGRRAGDLDQPAVVSFPQGSWGAVALEEPGDGLVVHRRPAGALRAGVELSEKAAAPHHERHGGRPTATADTLSDCRSPQIRCGQMSRKRPVARLTCKNDRLPVPELGVCPFGRFTLVFPDVAASPRKVPEDSRARQCFLPGQVGGAGRRGAQQPGDPSPGAETDCAAGRTPDLCGLKRTDPDHPRRRRSGGQARAGASSGRRTPRVGGEDGVVTSDAAEGRGTHPGRP